MSGETTSGGRTACLDDNLITEFLEGALNEAETERIERHIDACSTCRQLLYALVRLQRPRRTTMDPLRTRNASPPISSTRRSRHSSHVKAAVSLEPFELHERIGRGGMGDVWKGIHVAEGTPVAVKVITEIHADEPSFRSAFVREVQAMARLNHHGIAMVFDYGELPASACTSANGLAAHSPYIAMEYAGGGTLRGARGPMDWGAMRETLFEILAALAHAHARGVIHRDLKPGNILIADEQSPRPGLKLSDFGIAHAMDDFSSAGEQHISGTPHYMAPEQILGHWRDYGPWTDLYALGCVAYQLATGSPPFSGDSVRELADAHLHHAPLQVTSERYPMEFDDWLQRLLSKSHFERFACAADAADALREMKSPRTTFSDSVSCSTRSSFDQLVFDRTSERQLFGAGLGLYGLRQIPLVDRESERHALWSALQKARRERRALGVVLRGAAGQGKSRLARWLCEGAQELGIATILEAIHTPSGGPEHGLSRMIASHLASVDLDRTEVLARTERILRSQGGDDPYEWHALTELISPATELQRTSGEHVQFDQDVHRYAVVERHLRRLSSRRPVVLWLDDVQWGYDGLKLVDHLMANHRAKPWAILIVMTVREEALAERPNESELLRTLLERPEISSIAVEPLAPNDQVSLVRELLVLDEALAARIAEHTAGNPLFTIHLVGDWVQRGLLELGESGFELKHGQLLELPDDLHRVWVARLKRLVEELVEGLAREAVERAAIRDELERGMELAAFLGQIVDTSEWSHACRAAGLDFHDGLLTALTDGRLARPNERGWSFVHGMLRECLRRLAHERGRERDHHLACAQMLKERYPQRAPGVAERLGLHLLAAGALEPALDPLLAASVERREYADCPSALELLKKRDDAIELLGLDDGDPRRASGWLASSRVLFALNELDEAKASALRCVEAEPAPGKTVLGEALLMIAEVDTLQGALPEALENQERALPLLRDGDDEEPLFRCFKAIVYSLHWTGRDEEAQRYFDELNALTEGAKRNLGRAYGLSVLCVLLRWKGDHAAALEMSTRAIDACKRSGSLQLLGPCWNGRGEIQRELGELEAAEESYRQAAAALEQNGDSSTLWVVRYNLSLTLLARSSYQEALELLHLLLESAEAGQDSYHLDCRCALVATTAGLGRWEAMDENVEAVEMLLDRTTYRQPDQPSALELANELALARGQADRARRVLALVQDSWTVS